MTLLSSYLYLVTRLRRLIALEIFVYLSLLVVCFIIDLAATVHFPSSSDLLSLVLTYSIQLLLSGFAVLLWLLGWYKLTMRLGRSLPSSSSPSSTSSV